MIDPKKLSEWKGELSRALVVYSGAYPNGERVPGFIGVAFEAMPLLLSEIDKLYKEKDKSDVHAKTVDM